MGGCCKCDGMDETTNGRNVVDVEGAGDSKLSGRLTMSSGIKPFHLRGMEWQKSRQV